MTSQPTLTTERLVLRPFTLADAAEVQRLAGDRAIADMTLNIPHPYPDGAAEGWIVGHAEMFENGEGITYAITDRATGQLFGAISLRIDRRFDRAEMGYWLGRASWNQGFATEAARALILFGFQRLGLHRVYATHLVRNPASGRVMQKAGMIQEAALRQHVKKNDRYEDLCLYGILASDLTEETRRQWTPSTTS